jgi:hypothetical protein
MSAGIVVDVVSCVGVPQIAGRKAVEVLARTLGGLELSPQCPEREAL